MNMLISVLIWSASLSGLFVFNCQASVPLPTDACVLPSLPENTVQCPRLGKTDFLADLEASLDIVIAKYPEYFDMTDIQVPGQPRVVRAYDYHYAVAAELQKRGYCTAIDDRFEEIGVKKTNEKNEQFDIFRGDGYVRRGFGSYRATCRPAAF